MVYDPENVARNLRVLRAGRKVTQEELAKDIGVNPGTIVNWESGKNTPNFEKMSALADYFNVTLDYIRNNIA